MLIVARQLESVVVTENGEVVEFLACEGDRLGRFGRHGRPRREQRYPVRPIQKAAQLRIPIQIVALTAAAQTR